MFYVFYTIIILTDTNRSAVCNCLPTRIQLHPVRPVAFWRTDFRTITASITHPSTMQTQPEQTPAVRHWRLATQIAAQLPQWPRITMHICRTHPASDRMAIRWWRAPARSAPEQRAKAHWIHRAAVVALAAIPVKSSCPRRRPADCHDRAVSPIWCGIYGRRKTRPRRRRSCTFIITIIDSSRQRCICDWSAAADRMRDRESACRQAENPIEHGEYWIHVWSLCKRQSNFIVNFCLFSQMKSQPIKQISASSIFTRIRNTTHQFICDTDRL